jgi:hypothetical protein
MYWKTYSVYKQLNIRIFIEFFFILTIVAPFGVLKSIKLPELPATPYHTAGNPARRAAV